MRVYAICDGFIYKINWLDTLGQRLMLNGLIILPGFLQFPCYLLRCEIVDHFKFAITSHVFCSEMKTFHYVKKVLWHRFLPPSVQRKVSVRETPRTETPRPYGNEWAVRILLECILVSCSKMNVKSWQL